LNFVLSLSVFVNATTVCIQRHCDSGMAITPSSLLNFSLSSWPEFGGN